ncbi:MAG: hypothetical protein H6719_19000 [Sandaracinaceae bacterium]|nr:hypothetical protein [Sandaracinaceae bacterium]
MSTSSPPSAISTRWSPAWTDRTWLLAAVLWVGVFHLPSIGAGFVSDDAYTSLTAGVMRMRDVSMLTLIAEDVSWWAGEGRFFPVSLTTTLHYALFPGLVAYKVVKLLTLMAVVGLWGIVVRRLGGCRATALLAVVLTGVLFQYRLYHDAVLSFGWQLPQAVALFLGGVLLHLEAERTGDRRRMLASAALFFLGVLAYEIVLPMVAVHVALALPGRTRWQTARHVAPHLVAAAAFVVILVGLRVAFGGSDNPSAQVRILPIQMLVLMIRHAWAALPLSYAITEGTLLEPRVIVPGGVALLLVAAALVVAGRARRVVEPSAPDASRRLALVASLIWLLSSAMISPSNKYQQEVAWGLGYLPVFLGAFGAAALIAQALIAGLRALRPAAAQWALLAVMAPLILLTYQHNVAIADTLATQWRYPREVLTGGLDHGLLDGDAIERGVWIQSWTERPPPWERAALFALHADASPSAVWTGELPDARLELEGDAIGGALRRLREPVTYVTYGAPTQDAGIAVGGVAEHLTEHLPRRPVAYRARIFLRRPAIDEGGRGAFGYFPPLPHGARLLFDEFGPGGQVVHRSMWIERGAAGPGLTLRARGDGWELWDLDATPDHGLALHTFRVSLLPN